MVSILDSHFDNSTQCFNDFGCTWNWCPSTNPLFQEYIMSMCNPAVEEKIVYPADLHEHLVGKGGKTHRYLESNSR